MENVINLELITAYDKEIKEALSSWQKSTPYTLDMIVQYKGKYLKCTTSGTSSSDSLDPTLYVVGDTITDGTVVWTVVDPFTGGVSEEDAHILRRDVNYNLEDTVNKGLVYLKCVEAGKTSQIPLSLSGVIVGQEIVDGTVKWEVVSVHGVQFNGGTRKLDDVSDVLVEAGSNQVTLEWTDPPNVVEGGAIIVEWLGTKLIRKQGSAPTNINDGTLVLDSLIRDEYASVGYEDINVVNGIEYYYRWFPYTPQEVYTYGTIKRVTPSLYPSGLTVDKKFVTTFNGGNVTANVTSDSSGNITVESSDISVVTVSYSGGIITFNYVSDGEAIVTVYQEADGDYRSGEVNIKVKSVTAVRYGYKIDKNESDPYARVTYMYDAVGMTPAFMDFSGGQFNYGSWQNVWFVADNKPLMLKSNGTVDYYLNPNNYDYKEDGITPSDVSNTAYDGNAMAQFPLCWVYRYEDADYCYEIVSNVQYDTNYKAYAHTRADGSIAEYFYWSCFGGSGNATKIRSLAGQTLSRELTAQQEITGATANGSKWYTHTWSQKELIRTLCVLLGKSTNTQAVFGNGNCRSATAASGLLTTGTLDAMGQFFGYNDSTHQVKVFHIEKFWGDQWDRTAGVINSGGKVYVKMTPEWSGYRISDVTGYTNTGVTLAGTSGGYISAATCSELGIIPVTISGSGTTYYADGAWFNNSQLDYLLAGASAHIASTIGGAFAFDVSDATSNADWDLGCGLSCEQPNI